MGKPNKKRVSIALLESKFYFRMSLIADRVKTPPFFFELNDLPLNWQMNKELVDNSQKRRIQRQLIKLWYIEKLPSDFKKKCYVQE